MIEEVEDILAEEESPSYYQLFVYYYEQYGWYILFLAVATAYGYTKLRPTIQAYLKKKEDNAYSAKYHKDPDAVAKRLAAQDAHIRKLQEQYDQAAEINKIKAEERETRKREEWLQRHGEEGKKLGSAPKTLKSDYNPLMGDSSRGYRPEKKKACGGGGCGK